MKNGMKIEFKRKDVWYKGSVYRVEKECIYINVHSIKEEETWRFLGIPALLPIPTVQVQEYFEVNE